jgi:ribosomal protein S19E (S16A)
MSPTEVLSRLTKAQAAGIRLLHNKQQTLNKRYPNRPNRCRVALPRTMHGGLEVRRATLRALERLGLVRELTDCGCTITTIGSAVAQLGD